MEIDRRVFVTGVGAGVATAWAAPEVLSLSAPAAAASNDPPPDPPLSPVLLGVHPQAAAQPTEWGRRIQELIVFDGIVFAGFGDWNDNTGPIPASGWDISSSTWVNESTPGTLDNESTWVYRRIGDRLVVPFIDPKWNTGDLAVRSLGSSTWTTMAIGAGTAGTIHAFDVATFADGDLWVAGADILSDDAAVWHSASGLGGDWVKVHTFVPPPGNYARYTMLVTYNGRLYTGGYYTNGPTGAITPAEAWTGAAWVAAPEFSDVGGGVHRRGHRPMVFDGGVVRARTWPFVFSPWELIWFDGTNATMGPELSFHHNIDDSGNLWWIDETLAVRRRPPGGPTQFVVQAPAGASALAVDGTDLYIATAASQLYLVAGV